MKTMVYEQYQTIEKYKISTIWYK